MKDDALPDVLAALIEQVVRGTRLWPAEKRDVSAELESHFRDGLQQLAEEGLSEPEAVALLRERFGSPKVAAKLIRRGKKRNRSIIWKMFVRATCVLVILIGVTIVYAVWLLVGEANPTIDYISKANEPIDAIPVEDRAWPILREVILDLNPMPDKVLEIRKRLAFLPPGDDSWEEAMAWVESNSHLIPKVYQAASKRAYGVRYDNAASRAFLMALLKHQGKIKKEAQVSKNQECIETNWHESLLFNILLPSLPEMRTVAWLLVLDARGHLANGDFHSSWLSLEATHRLGIQLLATGGSLVEQLGGTSITNLASEGTRRGLYEHQDKLTPEELDRLGTSLAIIEQAAPVSLNYELVKYTYEDVVQRLFTDDGDGDGALIPRAFKVFRFESFDKPENREMSHWEKEIASLSIAAVHAGRKETLSKLAELWEINTKRMGMPLYDPQWRRIDESQEALFSHSRMNVRFALIDYFRALGSWDLCMGRAEMLVREARMNRSATLAVVAMLRYRADLGRYPDRLDALVPDYLEQVPEDVYCAGGLRYALGEDGRALLYSVGRNLIDDGGSSAKLTEGATFAKVDDPADIIYWPPSEH